MSEQTEPEATADDETAAAAEPEFTNRAARRAKKSGKGGNPQAFAPGKTAVGRGSVQSPRQYGNRRSG